MAQARYHRVHLRRDNLGIRLHGNDLNRRDQSSQIKVATPTYLLVKVVQDRTSPRDPPVQSVEIEIELTIPLHQPRRRTIAGNDHLLQVVLEDRHRALQLGMAVVQPGHRVLAESPVVGKIGLYLHLHLRLQRPKALLQTVILGRRAFSF